MNTIPPAGGVTAYGTIGQRIAAYALDALLAGLATLGGVLVAVVAGLVVGQGSAEAGVAVFVVGYLLAGLGYAILVWRMTAIKGYSPGKKLLGLRLVDATTSEPIGWFRVWLRGLVLSLVVVLTLGIGAVVLAVVANGHPRRQGWHDQAVRSVVVPESAASAPIASAPTPAVEVFPDGRRLSPPAPPAPQVVPAAPVPQVSSTDGNRALPPMPPKGPMLAAPENASLAPVAPPPGGVVPPPPGPSLPGPSAGAVLPPPTGSPRPVADAPSSAGQAERLAVEHDLQGISATETVMRRTSDDGAIHAEARQTVAGPTWTLAPHLGTPLVVHATVLVGRDPDPALVEGSTAWVLDDPERTVSKTHAVVGVDDQRLWIEDWNSTNGTVIRREGGDTELTPRERTLIEDGDVILLGDFELTARCDR